MSDGAHLQHILVLAARGWRLFPCESRGKKPLVSDWPRRATCEPAEVKELWSSHSGANVAIATGGDSGIFVLDVDGQEGSDSLLRWAEGGDELPDTLRVKTARGWHFYFTWPEGVVIRNSASRLAPGLDVRGEGGYVIGPPSVHESGHIYSFADPSTAVVAAPGWLLGRISQSSKTESALVNVTEETIPEGKRNATLISLAGTMRRKGMTPEAVEAALLAENSLRCRPPLTEAEVCAIAKSGSRYEPAPSKPKGVLQLIRASEVAPEVTRWLSEPYIPADRLTLLCGDPGVGKSYLALAIAAEVTRGTVPITGDPSTGPKPVLYLSNEDTAGALRLRFDLLGGRPELLFLENVEGESFWLSNEAALQDAVREHQPALVVIDTVSSHFGAGRDSYKANEVSALLTPLSKLAERYSTAVLGLVHLNKSDQSRAIYRLQGSIAFVGTARSVLLCSNLPDDSTRRVLAQMKSNCGPIGKSREYSIGAGGFRWAGESDLSVSDLFAPESSADEKSAVEEAGDFLLQLLAQGPVTATEVKKAADHSGISGKTLYRAASQLNVSKGPEGFRGSWVWKLSRVGQEPPDLSVSQTLAESANSGQV